MDSPIDYPQIEINGSRFTVRFSQRSIYRLEKAGIDMVELSKDFAQRRVKMSQIYDLLAASIEPSRSAEDLTELVSLPIARQVVVDALGKVRLPDQTAARLREPAAKSN